MQEMKYFNEGNDCDICKNQLMTGRDGTVEDCRRRQNGLSCRFEERDIRTCPVYVEHQLITLKDSDPIHHIIELEEDWEQRLNPLNLIPLSHRTHNTITALYKQSNASMKATQTQLRSLIDYHFKEAGGYEKVLCDRFLVAPPLFFGENSPRENQDTGE